MPHFHDWLEGGRWWLQASASRRRDLGLVRSHPREDTTVSCRVGVGGQWPSWKAPSTAETA
jgi:hypothetical protein